MRDRNPKVVCRRAHAFTLIELLVVISIISVLIAILLPALSSARKSAVNVQCLSNLRQQSIALSIYSDNWNEYLIPAWDTSYSGNDRKWIFRAPKELGNELKNESMWMCPNRVNVNFNLTNLGLQTQGNYSINDGLTGFITISNISRIGDVKNPSKIFYIVDGGDYILWPSTVRTPSGGRFYLPGHNPNNAVITEPNNTVGFQADQDQGRHMVQQLNFSCPDGHAESAVSSEFALDDIRWIN